MISLARAGFHRSFSRPMHLPPKVVARFLEAQLHLGQVTLQEARWIHTGKRGTSEEAAATKGLSCDPPPPRPASKVEDEVGYVTRKIERTQAVLGLGPSSLFLLRCGGRALDASPGACCRRSWGPPQHTTRAPPHPFPGKARGTAKRHQSQDQRVS